MIAGGNVTLDYWMLSRPEIKTPEQLKGGAVAISRFGSAPDFIVRYALQRMGLTPVKDVAILQVGSLTERLAAMETKRVQATVLAPPAMYQAQTRGFNILADIAALGLPYQATGIATTRTFIRERTDVGRRYIKSHIEAVPPLQDRPRNIDESAGQSLKSFRQAVARQNLRRRNRRA